MIPKPMTRARATRETEQLADGDLVRRSRRGDPEAFAILWRRHARAARSVARSSAPSFDADDVVAEAFTAIYQTVLRGGGPDGSFRPYLFTTVRNVAAAWGRARREIPIEDAESIPDPRLSDEEIMAALDRSMTIPALATLPLSWKRVLWYSEVEQLSAQKIAPLLGIKPNAVSSLSHRAREGLRQAWLQGHITRLPAAPECRWVAERLGTFSRAGLGNRETARVETHLLGCARCRAISTETTELAGRHRFGLVQRPA